MQATIKQWFNNLPRREQLWVLVLGAVLALYIVFFLMLGPMQESVAKLQRQNDDAQQSLDNVNALVAQFNTLNKANGGSKAALHQNLNRLIDSSVKENNLQMNRFQPSSSGDIQVRFENAVFNNILAWLHQLEVDNAVIIKDLSISPGNAGGLVNVSVRVRQGV